MMEKTVEQFFIPILFITFFLMACGYNIAYFNTFGDAYSYFLYVPFSFFDLIKTGLYAFLLSALFLIIFKPILVDPVFQASFPGPATIFALSLLVFISNLFYFVIFPNPSDQYSLISEILFFTFCLVCFFGILYFFIKEKSPQFLMVVFFISLVLISLLMGWISARVDIRSVQEDAKSKILLKSNQIVTAKILRSFDKGIFVIVNNESEINFISWEEIKEAKFKKVSGL